MSAASARAEARRKAILARGSDRLTRLTSSARGEDAPQLATEEIPAQPTPKRPARANITSLENFVGEDTPTTPSRGAPAPNPFDVFGLGNAPPDPSAWSSEHQQQLLRALMSTPSSTTANTTDRSASPGMPVDDPLAALMSGMPPLGKGTPPLPGNRQQEPPKPKSLFQKLLPLIHLLSVWALVAYFVLFAEPAVSSAPVQTGILARRWSALSRQPPDVDDAWSVQAVPFFWAFITLELCLHSMRIFTGLDNVQPPMLLALALPHLPAPLGSVVTHTLKYIRMAGALLDDIAAALFAFAVCILVASALDT